MAQELSIRKFVGLAQGSEDTDYDGASMAIFPTTMSIESTGDLITLTGYTGESGIQQVLATPQVDPQDFNVTIETKVLNRAGMQAIFNAHWGTETTISWKKSHLAIVTASEVTDAAFGSLTAADVSVAFWGDDASPDVNFLITAVAPTAPNEVQLDTANDKLVFHSSWNGKTIRYVIPVSDTTNTSSIGRGSEVNFNSLEITAVMGTGTGFLRVYMPRVVRNTAWSIGGGAEQTYTINGKPTLVAGFSSPVVRDFVEDLPSLLA